MYKFSRLQKNSFIGITVGIIFILMILGISPNIAEQANAAFTGILVLVTVIYVIFTGAILEESTKSREDMTKARKVEFIEKQIEEFYIPFKKFFEDEVKVRFIIDSAKNNKFSSNVIEFLDRLDNTTVINSKTAGLVSSDTTYKSHYFELTRRKYLVESDLKENVEDFFRLIDSHEKLYVLDMKSFLDNLYFAILDDIESLTDELYNLTGKK